MVYLLYDFIILIAACILLPFFCLKRILTSQESYGIRERLGFYEKEKFGDFHGREVIWIHAASVGETRVAILVARRMKELYSDYTVLVTNMTKSGLAVSANSEFVDYSLLFPVDLSFVVKRLLTLVRPELIIVVETEIWPNFTQQAHQLGIPLVLVNGRISDRSFPRYRLMRFLLRPILDCFSSFCMQSQTDSERITVLGAPGARVENTGNLKFDYDLMDVTADQVQQKIKQFKLPGKAAILVAGSTHEKEERQLLEAYRQISAQLDRDLVLVLIPRHPERKLEVQSLLRELGFGYKLRSSLQEGDNSFAPGDVLLVDTLGEVLDFYSIADLVFVGGSLVRVGGHNLLEAALLAKPVIFGPYVNNFKEISAKLIRAGAGVKVANQRELVRQSVIMLNDPARCRAMGQAGSSLILENAGATERILRHITKALK